MAYQDKIFSFDISPSAIGFCVFAANGAGDAEHIIDMGVRVFPTGREPQKSAGASPSLAAARTVKRSIRRGRDRFLGRRHAAAENMKQIGLLPRGDKEFEQLLRETAEKPDNDISNTVYALRVRAREEQIPLYYLGRLFYHLLRRRGFKSSRKTEGGENESGKIAAGIVSLDAELMNKSYSQWLYERVKNNEVVRLRKDSSAYTEDAKTPYAFYASRAMIEEEFDAIWAAQAQFYPGVLTDERRDALREIIFHQRPLKPVDCGVCLFYPNERRLAKADPLFQELRIYQELNHIRICAHGETDGRPLTLEERDKLALLLAQQKNVKFSKMKKVLNLLNNESINLEVSRDGLEGNLTSAIMRNKKYFGAQWAAIPFERQRAIISKLNDETLFPEELDKWLADNCPQLSADERKAVQSAALPEGYGRLGITASMKILKELKDAVISYAGAAQLAGLVLKSAKENRDFLPKYQEIEAIYRQIIPGTNREGDDYDKRMGRISNPTVHIALNQLRLVANALLKKHGKPRKILVAVGRELKMNDREIREYNKNLYDNKRLNQEADEKMQELGLVPTAEGRQRYRLWTEIKDPANRVCIYSGKPISVADLFTGGKVEIGHILPLSATLDDSMQNKILCYSEANREKGNRAPADVFAWSPNYEDILSRAQFLPEKKRWRFNRDAMARFEDENGFLSRQITDMQYITRIAAEYLSALYPEQEEKYNKNTGELFGKFFSKRYVFPISKHLVGKIRYGLGLFDLPNENDEDAPLREDHRRHAVDAAIIGLCTPSAVRTIMKSLRETEPETPDGSNSVAKSVAEGIAWPDFRAELNQGLERIITSHRPRRTVIATNADRRKGHDKTGGQLHKETLYGKEKRNIPIADLDFNDLEEICDEKFRQDFVNFLKEAHGIIIGRTAKRTFSYLWDKEHNSICEAFVKQYPQYGALKNFICWGRSVVKKPFLELDAASIASIRDVFLRRSLQEFLSQELGIEFTDSLSEKDFLPHEKKILKTELGKALQKFKETDGQYQGIRHVRLFSSATAPIALRDKKGGVYAFVQGGNNFRFDIWQYTDKKGTEKWVSDTISMFDAVKPEKMNPLYRRPHPAAKRVLSLQQNDMVAYTDLDTGRRVIGRVVKFTQSGQIGFAPHNVAASEEVQMIKDMKKLMTEWKCRKVSVNAIGQVIMPQL